MEDAILPFQLLDASPLVFIIERVDPYRVDCHHEGGFEDVGRRATPLDSLGVSLYRPLYLP